MAENLFEEQDLSVEDRLAAEALIVDVRAMKARLIFC
jgi:hypothetical protein